MNTQELGPNQLLWLSALESGDYKQLKGQLKGSIPSLDNLTDCHMGHCCLGVAAELYPDVEMIEEVGDWVMPRPDKDYGNSTDLEGTGVGEWLGMHNPSDCRPLWIKSLVEADKPSSYREDPNLYRRPMRMNDSGDHTFKDIAATIRAEPSLYFKESK